MSTPHTPFHWIGALALSLAMGAHASESHGDGHEAPKPAAKSAAKGEPKAESKSEGKGEAETPAEKPVASGVSMTELRDLIDQKIAEVRTKQEAAPVVRVVTRAPRAKPKPRPEMLALNSEHGGGHGAPGNSPQALAAAEAHRSGAEGHDVHWAYGGDTGPDSWGMLKPDFKTCMMGKRQSPIDIRDGIKVQLEPIQFEYRPTPFKVLDNGHTVQVNLEPGNSITVLGRRYDLVQFHFHRPSEERINGRQYEMVAHLVHKDSEGKLAVVAVLMDQGMAHPMVQLVWNSLPLEKGTEQYSPVMLDMNMMLPESKQYYTYMGSLTTPPCSEGVLWMVMKQPATLSREQINVFARMYPMNARPIQSAAGRMIKDGQ
jgi:carbonic anhydrase